MATFRVRREEVETEKRTDVSYATFTVATGDDPAVEFRRLKRAGSLKWVDASDEDENDYDYDEIFDKPELIDDSDEDVEPPVRGKPSDYGLQQLSLV